MLKKTNNPLKGGNIAKIKYFLPSNSTNRQQNSQKVQTTLNKIKKSIHQKYNRSYSSSKTNTKRHSAAHQSKFNQHFNQQMAANDDISFQIVGIRDITSKQASPTKLKFDQKKYQYPLEQRSSNLVNYTAQKIDLKMTFGSTNHKNKHQQYKILQDSRKALNMNQCNQFQKLLKEFPKKQQRKQFEQFLQKLKDDQNYQNTISMFTIMYFYEQKNKKK